MTIFEFIVTFRYIWVENSLKSNKIPFAMLKKILPVLIPVILLFSPLFAQTEEVTDEILLQLLKQRDGLKQQMAQANEAEDYDKYKELEESWNILNTKINQRQELIQSSLKEAQRLLKTANSNIRDRKYSSALTNLEKVLSYQEFLDSDKIPEIRYLLAFCLERLKKYPQALDEYSKVIVMKPNWSKPYSGKARVLSGMGDDSEAVAAYKKAVEYDPDDAKNYFFMAISYQKLRMMAEAENNYRLATEKDTTYDKAFYNLGVVRAELRKYLEAIETLKKTVQLDPKHYQAFTLLAKVYNTVGRHAESLDAAESAINIRPNYAEAHFEKGVALEKTERYNLAIKAFEMCLNDRAWRESAQWHINLIKEKYLQQ